MTRTIAQIETDGGEDELRRDDYFPTLIYSAVLHDSNAMNKEIMAAITAERERDAKGIERSNYRSLGGWHSHNNLHKEKGFARLSKRIHNLTSGISKNLGYATNRRLEITTMWAISNPPGAGNRSHIHPGAVWSGVYYAQAPEGAGKISLTDPRVVNVMHQPTYTEKSRRKTECWTKVSIKPIPGKILFFPSWLYHEIAPNMTTETGAAADRVIVAFNINQRLKPKKKTS